jgi:hypothetical protein
VGAEPLDHGAIRPRIAMAGSAQCLVEAADLPLDQRTQRGELLHRDAPERRILDDQRARDVAGVPKAVRPHCVEEGDPVVAPPVNAGSVGGDDVLHERRDRTPKRVRPGEHAKGAERVTRVHDEQITLRHGDGVRRLPARIADRPVG